LNWAPCYSIGILLKKLYYSTVISTAGTVLYQFYNVKSGAGGGVHQECDRSPASVQTQPGPCGEDSLQARPGDSPQVTVLQEQFVLFPRALLAVLR
jgi:hypothetical protein